MGYTTLRGIKMNGSKLSKVGSLFFNLFLCIVVYSTASAKKPTELRLTAETPSKFYEWSLVRSSSRISAVALASDRTSGWAVGASGTILRYAGGQ